MSVAITLENYNKYVPFMRAAIHKVHKAIGGDIDEMLANMWLLFVKACQNYKPNAGRKFSSYLYKVCWDDTYAERRIACHRKAHHPMVRLSDNFDIAGRTSFDLPAVMDELSSDARQAIQFVLNPPSTVKRTKDDIPKRNSVFVALKTHFKWSADQLEQVCEEIRSSLF